MALPSPPFVNIEGVRNLRDIGGYRTNPGYCIRRGLVYRSANFGKCTENGLEQLRSLDISNIFDLRSKREIEQVEAAEKGLSNDIYKCWKSLPNGPRYNLVPIFEDDDYSPETLAKRFRDYASDGTEVSNQILHEETSIFKRWLGF